MDFDVKALLAPPNPFTFKKILCVQPHPDDNEIGMGDTIAVLAAQGCVKSTARKKTSNCRETLSLQKGGAQRRLSRVAKFFSAGL